MRQSRLWLAPFVIVIISASVRAEDTRQLTISSQQTILEKDDVQLHFPFLHEAKNGTWYMTYREGRHVSKQETVYCITSSDRGKSWKPWTGLTPEPLLRLFRQRLADGTLISHRYLFPIDENGEGDAFILRSSDDGATWSKTAARVTGLPFNSERLLGFWGRVVAMPDGRLLCGIYGSRPGGRKYVNCVVQSTDGGRGWSHLADLCGDWTIGNEGPNEMDLVRLKSGELLSVFRSGTNVTSRMQQVRSTDGGKSWSKPRALGMVGVSPQLLLLENGVLICTFGTRDVHVMASWDGSGRKWSKPLLIYKGEGSGYTDLQALSADTFRMVFDQSPFFSNKPGGKIVRVVISTGK